VAPVNNSLPLRSADGGTQAVRKFRSDASTKCPDVINHALDLKPDHGRKWFVALSAEPILLRVPRKQHQVFG
jgi:hypothetical protein